MPGTEAPFDALLGRPATLAIHHFGPAGAFLAQPGSGNDRDAPCLLLLGSEIPEGAREGAELSVFVYLDSQDRPIATTAVPAVMLGQVAFLEVTALTAVGAFCDWGLPKELLVPFAQQTTEPKVGERHPVGLYVDNTGRLAGTMRVSELLDLGPSGLVRGDWVDGEAWRNDPEIGLFVILSRAFVGLVPRQEPHSMQRGQAGRFRVAHVHRDGKVELSLRGLAHTELDADAQNVLHLLQRAGTPSVGDRSDPDLIRQVFGLSKKAFKRAVGRLLAQGLLEVDPNGHVVPRPPARRRSGPFVLTSFQLGRREVIMGRMTGRNNRGWLSLAALGCIHCQAGSDGVGNVVGDDPIAKEPSSTTIDGAEPQPDSEVPAALAATSPAVVDTASVPSASEPATPAEPLDGGTATELPSVPEALSPGQSSTRVTYLSPRTVRSNRTHRWMPCPALVASSTRPSPHLRS
jgi:hypothetical protein